MSKIPSIVQDFNLIINGKGNCGKIAEVALPELAVKIYDHIAGGMPGPVPIHNGFEAMEMGGVLAEHDADVYSMFGLVDTQAAKLRFYGALKGDGPVKQMSVEANGIVKTVSPGTISRGEPGSMEFKMAIAYCKITIAGKEVFEYDPANGKVVCGGKDVWADIRNAISYS